MQTYIAYIYIVHIYVYIDHNGPHNLIMSLCVSRNQYWNADLVWPHGFKEWKETLFLTSVWLVQLGASTLFQGKEAFEAPTWVKT